MHVVQLFQFLSYALRSCYEYLTVSNLVVCTMCTCILYNTQNILHEGSSVQNTLAIIFLQTPQENFQAILGGMMTSS